MSYEIQPTRHNHQQGTKWASKVWPKVTENANFGPNLVVFGQKILIFTGESKNFGTHITEKPPRHLVHIVFWSGMGWNGPKMLIFGPKWPKMHILDQIWPKILIRKGGSKSFGSYVTKKTPRHLVCIVFWSAKEPNWPNMQIFCQKSKFWAKFGRLWAKNPNFYRSK